VPGVELRRFAPDLGARLASAAASVSQCGYNTTPELLRAGLPSLVVPFAERGEDEQTRRAARLERRGALRVLAPDRLEPSTLAREIRALLDFRPRQIDLDCGGAETSTALLEGFVGAARSAEAVVGG
jgi:predicted glycosyltransferase